MNYFAHALPFLNRPVFVIGTSLPDMLSVADRRVRLRERLVEPFADGSGSFGAELAAGTLQHLQDDDWFHRTPGFHEITGQLARLFRQSLPDDDSPRVGFLGHIVAELQLDGALSERYPRAFEHYYTLLAAVDEHAVEACVNQMARQPTDRLARLIRAFRDEQFMRCYTRPGRLLRRLNQIMLRVRLEPLPEAFEEPLAASWNVVRDRVEDLLPPGRFNFPVSDFEV